jgi:hypothetical protein
MTRPNPAAGLAYGPQAGPPMDPAAHNGRPRSEARTPPSTVEGERMSVLLNLIHRFPMWVVLAVMAAADAYVFWNTLARLMQRQVELLWVFVVALSAGAVAACHYAGRLLRVGGTPRVGRYALVGLILSAWLALGLVIVWIRSHEQLYQGDQEDGPLGAPASDAGPAAVFVALLMLCLYLLTGLLTIAHSLHYGDPVAQRAQLRRLQRRRSRRLAKLRHEAQLAENRARQHEADLEREQEYFDAQNERHDAWTHLLGELARVRMAVTLGDPAATDGLFPPPGAAAAPPVPPAVPPPAPPEPTPPPPPPPPPAPDPPPPAPPPPTSRPTPPPYTRPDPDRPTRTGSPT